MKQRIVIVDIDGTLMNIEERVKLGKPFIVKEEDLHYYDSDFANEALLVILRGLILQGYKIIFLSGRTELGRLKTEQQIASCDIPYLSLLMRQDGDFRKDTEIKEEFYNKLKEDYEISMVFDDRLSVCQMWYRLGVPLFRVGDPDSNF